MLGVFLTVIGSVLEELANSLGKYGIKHKIQSVDMLGFLSNFWTSIFFLALVVYRWPEMHIATWPTLLIRLPLEIIPAWLTVRAIALCSRSTFGFVRVTTIPALLLADTLMGYHLDPGQIAGITLITFSLFLLYTNHGFEKRGLAYVLAASLMPVITSTLLRYNLNHGNSLELEQLLVSLLLTAFFLVMVRRRGEDPIRAFTRPILLAQAACHAAASIVLAFGFYFTLPSVHMAAKRSGSLMSSLAFGRYMFHEKKMRLKILAMAVCIIGIVLLLF